MTLRAPLLALALLAAACGGSDPSPTPGDGASSAAASEAAKGSPTSDAASAEAPPTGTKVGESPPNFELPVLSGGSGRLALADLRGKVVVLTFWASWCGPCRMEVPALEKPWKELRDTNATIVGVSIDDDEAAANSFLKLFPVTYPMLLDAGGRTVADAWGVSSIPATVVLDKQGVVRKRHLGYSPTMLANTLTFVRELEQE